DGLLAVTVATYPGWLTSGDGSDGSWSAHGDTAGLLSALDHAPLPVAPPPRLTLSDPHGFAPYRAAVEAIREGIAAGDYYQVNLARRLEGELEDELGPALFFALRQAQPAAFSTLWALPDGWLTSGSPECLLRFDERTRRAHTYPIKGTIGRGDDEADDEALAARLMASEKDRAEHVMIVDLARNDLGRLASKVEVESLYATLPLKTLRHLVSDIAADIRPNVTLGQLVGALFPGGSITGAPKIAAMNAITHHEPFARGFYCGSLGLVFPDEAVFSILIRTAVVSGGRLVYPVGGGLVWDSVAEDEWRETELKAQALLRAISG
ncbi:MAG TPA: chorismate-binding protein, partial [Myxococcota bacterium]|nr:chorismate-binding protein [Myxococcota bacterium]